MSDEMKYYTHLSGGFGNVAEIMVDNGWSIFPQTRDRKPGVVFENGKQVPIQWKEKHHLDTQLPDPHVLKTWIENCYDLNVACVFGQSCSNVFALDIDITDKKIAKNVEKMVINRLGSTPLRRIGNAPKIALFYRSLTPINSVSLKLQKVYDENTYEKLSPEEKNCCRRRLTHDDNGNDVVLYDVYNEQGDMLTDDQMIEIAGTNKLMTIWGIHHKTGKPFNWMGYDEELGDYRSPLNTRPEDLPIVSPNAIQEVLDSVFSFYNQYYGRGMSGGKRIGTTTSVWTEDADGKISDGRENWLWRNCISLALRHYDEIREAGERNMSSILDNLTDKMAGSLNDINDYGQFGQYCVIDGKWNKDEIRSQSRSKLVRQMRRICRGEIKKKQIEEDHKIITNKNDNNSYSFSDNDKEFSWMTKNNRIIPFGENDSRLNFHVMKSDRNDSMEIPSDRKFIMDSISDGIQGSISSFLNRLYLNPTDNGFCVSFTEMLVAPTGSGKTSQFLQRIAEDPRTYIPFTNLPEGIRTKDNEECSHPFIFMMPNYENINEQFKKVCLWGINTQLNDEEIAKEAVNRGYGSFDDALRDIDFIRYQASSVKLPEGIDRLNVMIWKGKVRGGCKIPDIINAASSFGYGSQNFCMKKRSMKEREESPELGEYDFCQFYNDCPVIKQRQRVRSAHLVFMPHAFIQLSQDLLPEPLKKPRAVLVDERVYQYFLHTETLDIEVLKTERAIPAMSRFEKEEYRDDEEGYIDNIAEKQNKRNQAVDILLESLNDGLDVSKVFFELENGHSLLHDTMTLLKANLRRDMRLKPNMDLDDVKKICDVDNGRFLREELQLWTIINERMRWIKNDIPYHNRIKEYKKRLVEINNLIAITDDDILLQEYTNERIYVEQKIVETNGKIRARGYYDYRLQVIFNTEPQEYNIKVNEEGETEETDPYKKEEDDDLIERPFIRMSWRSKPNWKDRPTILLDASAAPEIIRKIWDTNGLIKIDHGYKKDWIPPVRNELVVRNIVSEDQIGRSLNMRMVAIMPWTNSASSFSGKNGSIRLEKTRQLIDCVSLIHSDSRIVCGSNKNLRNRIRYNWHGIDNQDWCHFGAMRGLDMFKNHAAALYVGRMELPIHLLDGLVGALTYDDERPEPPLDIWGTGFREMDDKKTPLMMPKSQQINYVRNGNKMSIDVPRMPEHYPIIKNNFVEPFEKAHGDELPFKWGQLIQKQYREEEIMQFVGRLRPVYREGHIPVCYAFSTVIPENIIIDEVVHVDEIINGKIERPSNKKKTSASRRFALASFLERHKVIGDHIIDIVGDFVSANVKNLMILNGLNPENGSVSGRLERGIGVIQYEYNGDSYYAFVPTYRSYEESCEIIKNILMIYDDNSPDIVEFTRKSWPVSDVKASIREEDNVDIMFGKDRTKQQNNDESLMGILLMHQDEEKKKEGSLTYHKTERTLQTSKGVKTIPYWMAEKTNIYFDSL